MMSEDVLMVLGAIALIVLFVLGLLALVVREPKTKKPSEEYEPTPMRLDVDSSDELIKVIRLEEEKWKQEYPKREADRVANLARELRVSIRLDDYGFDMDKEDVEDFLCALAAGGYFNPPHRCPQPGILTLPPAIKYESP